jgi:tetratricopeptide (TPR) repeat protein
MPLWGQHSPDAHPPTDASPSLERLRKCRQIDFDIAFFARVLARDPDYVDALRCQGELLSRRGRHREALEIDRRLVALCPRDCFAHYNLACSLALEEHPEAALAELATSLELGYCDWEHLAHDTDLDCLRELPGYEELLRRHDLPT